jgi:hypothetical protein
MGRVRRAARGGVGVGVCVGVMVVALVLAACGADSSSSSSSASPTVPPTETMRPPDTAHTATTAPAAGSEVPTTTLPTSAPDGQPRLLTCTAYYRPLGDVSTEGAIEQTVELEAQPGMLMSEQSAEFDTMSFTVAFSGSEFEAESVLLYVFDSERNVLTQVLYQSGLDELAGIDLVGGHGFTGLHYVNHEGAQLQFWCSVS